MIGRVGLGVSLEVGGGLGKGVVVRSGKGKTIWWKMLEEMPYLIICFCLCLCGEKVGCYACRQTEFPYVNSKRIQIEFAKSSRYGSKMSHSCFISEWRDFPSYCGLPKV